MPQLLSRKRLSFTALDKAALDPETGCYNDIGLWSNLYLVLYIKSVALPRSGTAVAIEMALLFVIGRQECALPSAFSTTYTGERGRELSYFDS